MPTAQWFRRMFRASETREDVRRRAAALLRQYYRQRAEHGYAGQGERDGEEGDLAALYKSLI